MTIDFNSIREISYVGIRRSEIFMGFGINCAENKDSRKFDLHKYTMYKLAPDIESDDKINECKTEFKKWIIANSFRELSDSFESYLDHIYSVAIIVKPLKGKNKKYLHSGISSKLGMLKNEFGISSEFEDSFETINNVRNCLYHRRGIVGYDDINEQTKQLEIKWLGMDIGQLDNTGKFEKINYPIIQPVEVKEGKDVVIIHKKRKKVFQLSEEVAFSVFELSEICYHFKIETDNLYSSSMNFFIANNIVINKENVKKEES